MGISESPSMVLKKSKARPHIFIFIFFKCQKPMYGLDAHVWPREGVTPHSEIIVGVSHLNLPL